MKVVQLGKSPNYTLTAQLDWTGVVLTFKPTDPAVAPAQVILTAKDMGRLLYAWRQARAEGGRRVKVAHIKESS